MKQPVLRSAVLTGERVVLRPLAPGDVERAFSMLHGRDEILRWLVWDGPDSRADLDRFYASWITGGEHGHDYHFAICERETGAFAGSIGPRFLGHPGMGDVGYWLAPAYWNRGFMSEAVRLVNHLCFEHLGALVLYAYVFVGNDASRKVLERAGYRLEYLARGKTRKRGVPIDEWYFTVTREDWRKLEGWRPVSVEVELEE